MLRIAGGQKNCVKAIETPIGRKNMNHGDTFLIDAGKNLFLWQGKSTSPFEKSKAIQVAETIQGSRGKCHITVLCEGDDDNDTFWALVGGRGDIAPAEEEKKTRS